MNPISVCILCYGDHLDLAQRCLDSVLDQADYDVIADIRVGLNDVCDATAAYVYDVGRRACRDGCPHFYVFRPQKDGCTPDDVVRFQNVGKYPLMRRMFYSAGVVPLAPAVMWFDDDSFLNLIAAANLRWWQEVVTTMRVADMIGSPYKLRPRRGGLPNGYRGNQVEGIKAQPWYTGQPMDEPCTFAQGGWWVARTEILSRWHYPFSVLHHNGGDSILGELLRQQGHSLIPYKNGVSINWDGGESRAVRRGMVSPWPWEDYQPGFKPAVPRAFPCAPVEIVDNWDRWLEDPAQETS